MKRIKTTILIACLFISMLTVCFWTERSNAGERVSSACDVISKERVSEIFGEKFDEAKETQHRENGDIFMSLCTFTSSDPNSMSSCSVMVLYNPVMKEPAASAESHIKSFRDGIGDPNYAFEQIDNVGGAALYDQAMKQLIVFNEGRMMIFQGFGKDPKKQLIDMAEAALNG